MMNQYKKSLFVLGYVFLLCGLFITAGTSTTMAANGQKFTQEELVNLSRPSVVRIVQKVTGEITIKPFTLDLDALTITSGDGEMKKIPVDDYMTGSGFIVSEDGYILTNAHVISKKEIGQQYISDAATSAIMDASLWYMGTNTDLNDTTKMETYAKKINDFLLKESTFNLQQSTVVLNPSSKGEKIDDLIAEGFPIRVASINENYNEDFWDIALIKIEQKNLPALTLNESNTIKRGEQIGVFGFPTTAELNGKNLLESTFSQGVVSAIKDSEKKDFNIIQTDAKISTGSSGSPLLNGNGEVIGMITYQTNAVDATGGDNFAFAIPIDVVKEGIKKFNVNGKDNTFTVGKYYTQFANGLSFLHEAKCQKALAAFSDAKNTNENFDVSKNIETYEKRCQELIATHASIDTKWDEIRISFYSLSIWIWTTMFFALMLFVTGTIKFFMMKRLLKKEEAEIVVLEEEIKQNDERDKEDEDQIAVLKERLVKNDAQDKKESNEIAKIIEELSNLK